MWNNHSNVIMLSTVHSAVRDKPLVIKDYNNDMKGVDASDHMASYHPTTWWSKVWYRKIFLFDLALIVP